GGFDVFDGDGRGVDPEHTGSLAGSGADAAGKFRKVIGPMQSLEGFMPQSAIKQIVPFRDEVIDWTTAGHAVEERAGVAERDAAIHATRGLFLELVRVHVLVELQPVANALVSL